MPLFKSLDDKIIDVATNLRILKKQITTFQKKHGNRFNVQSARHGLAGIHARRVKLTEPGMMGRPVKLSALQNKRIKDINFEIRLALAGLRNWETKHPRPRQQ